MHSQGYFATVRFIVFALPGISLPIRLIGPSERTTKRMQILRIKKDI
jgi:hypothetical protein